MHIKDSLTSPDIREAIGDAASFTAGPRDPRIMAIVHDAIAEGRTLLAFQPVVCNGASSRIAFHEGLIRIIDRDGTMIPAAHFMSQIETTPMGRTIDCLALDHGLRALSADPALRLSINMSARSVGFTRWRRTLEKGLALDPTAGERLILESTESSAMLMPDIVVSFMSELQDCGISFALDDFGAGYTSFRYLRDFFFDIIKIDRGFITGIHANQDNQVLTRALVSIAAQFEMFTIAEGVETAEDAAYLQDSGVDCLQGYYFGAPRPEDARAWRAGSISGR